jgi:hypothetical protein
MIMFRSCCDVGESGVAATAMVEEGEVKLWWGINEVRSRAERCALAASECANHRHLGEIDDS